MVGTSWLRKDGQSIFWLCESEQDEWMATDGVVRHILLSALPAAPIWFRSGLPSFLRTMIVQDDCRVEFGRADREFYPHVAAHRIETLETLQNASRGDFRSNIWRLGATAWAFFTTLSWVRARKDWSDSGTWLVKSNGRRTSIDARIWTCGRLKTGFANMRA